MNTGNALGFLFFAGLMGLAPSIAPQWFPPTGMDGSSGRALWLELMAMVQSLVGVSHLLSRWIARTVLRPATYLPRHRRPVGAMLPASSTARVG